MRWPKIYYNRYTQRYEFALEQITEETNEHIQEIDRILKKIEDGEKSVDNVDWAGEIWEIMNINELMGLGMHSYCWLYPVIARVKDYDRRIDILEHLKEYSTRYFPTVRDMIDFIDDCEAMITVLQHIKLLPVPDCMLLQQQYDEKQWIKELTLAYTQTTLAPRMLMALAQERYNVDAREIRVDKVASVVLSLGHIKKFTIDNCVDFCKYIFVAEGYRQYLICGDPDYNETPTLETLNRKLRNACFDIYIRTRFEALQKEMDADNTRLFDPSDLEVYNRLYAEECRAYKRAEASSAANDEEVLVLVSYLLEYLKWKMPSLPDTADHDRKIPSGSIDRAILAVFHSGLCNAADWAAVIKVMEERNLMKKSDYSSEVSRIIRVCGNVTSATSVARSICMSKVKGTYPDWTIRSGEETRETPNKLKLYKEIAEIFIKALES